MKLMKKPPQVVTPEVVSEEDNRELLDLGKVSFKMLLDKSYNIQSLCEDFTIDKVTDETLRLNNFAGITYMTKEGEIRNPSISRHAMGQLCSKVGVPHDYMKKCIGSGRIELAQDNLNSWLSDFKKDLFICEYDGRIRGVLTPRYSVCDTPKILEAVQDAVDLNKFKIKGSFLNEERLHIRLVGKEMLPIDGEDLFAGLFLDSSDVGRNILTVKFGIYKQVCTNGLVIARAGGTLFEQKHVGITAEEFHSGLTSSLQNIDLLVDNAVEWVQRAKHRENHWSALSEYEDDINEFISYIRQKTNLSQNSAGKVIDLMKTKYEDNRWGLINSITEVAQDFTLERRLELEKIAGGLLVA